MVLLFYSLYLDKIAEKVEASVTGQVIECDRPTTQILGRMVVVGIITVVGTVTMLLIEIGANLIPFIGGLIALALIIPCEMFLTGIGFIDPYLIEPDTAECRAFVLCGIAFSPLASSHLWAGSYC